MSNGDTNRPDILALAARVANAAADGLGAFLGGLGVGPAPGGQSASAGLAATSPMGPPIRNTNSLGFGVPDEQSSEASDTFEYAPPAAPTGNLPARSSGVSQSGARREALVCVVGDIDVDFGTDANLEDFRRQMNLAPHTDPRTSGHLQKFLKTKGNESARAALTWILKIGGRPIYSLTPKGAYASETFLNLTDQLNCYSRITGTLSSTTTLQSGQTVRNLMLDCRKPVQMVRDQIPPSVPGELKGPSGNAHAHDMAYLTAPEAAVTAARYRFRNEGATPADRALSFVLGDPAFDGFFAAREGVFAWVKLTAGAIMSANSVAAINLVLEKIAIQDIRVRPSTVTAFRSEYYDVDVRYFDPNGFYRALFVVSHVIDVARQQPVLIGDPTFLQEWPT